MRLSTRGLGIVVGNHALRQRGGWKPRATPTRWLETTRYANAVVGNHALRQRSLPTQAKKQST